MSEVINELNMPIISTEIWNGEEWVPSPFPDFVGNITALLNRIRTDIDAAGSQQIRITMDFSH